MAFWIVSIGMCVIVLVAFAAAMLQRRAAAMTAAYDLQVYRDQLKEVDRDVARGVLSATDADRTRTEIKRRILEADRAAAGFGGEGRVSSKVTTIIAAAVSGVVILGGSYLTYTSIGAPGYPDLPLAERIRIAEETRLTRPSQEVAEADAPAQLPRTDLPQDYLDLVQQLRTTVAERPSDPQGHALLAQHEANIGNFRDAYLAKGRMLNLLGDQASGQDYADMAELLVLAAGGYVSPEAEGMLSRSLTRSPRNGIARYYTGLMYNQTGRPDLGFQIWSQLLEDSRADAPWQDPIRGQIEALALQAGALNYTVPPRVSDDPALPGPSQQQMQDAQEMTEEDRMEMIRGMVSGLSDRLATEGGTPGEWARLIRAYAVLGEVDRTLIILAEAREVFADSPEALDLFDRTANEIGIID